MSVLGLVAGTVGGATFGGLLMARAARQCRRPSNNAGRVVLQRMNDSHSRVTAWGLSHVSVGAAFTILDVGCGGGATIERLASMAPSGKVYGIDYSAESVGLARETNQPAIDQGRVDI